MYRSSKLLPLVKSFDAYLQFEELKHCPRDSVYRPVKLFKVFEALQHRRPIHELDGDR